MFRDYYKQQLDLLAETAREYADANPSIAGFLKDARREPEAALLLQGFAFLSANIQQELDGHFPKLLHSLAQIVAPHYLRPLPSVTIVSFQPKSNLLETIKVKSSAVLNSFGAYEEQRGCQFRTTREVAVSPIAIKSLNWWDSHSANSARQIKLDIGVQGVNLETLSLPEIRFFIDDVLATACDFYCLFTRFLTHIDIWVEGKVVHTLKESALSADGFGENDTIFPMDTIQNPIFETLQDYFAFPEKFLFLTLNLESWISRPKAQEFSLVFHFNEPDFPLPREKDLPAELFALFSVPAVNLFRQESEPVLLDMTNHEIGINPVRTQSDCVESYVYSVDAVKSIRRGNATPRAFQPITAFDGQEESNPRYSLALKPQINTMGYETYITLALPAHERLDEREVLKAELTCYNAEAAERLQPGEICIPSNDTPELVTFKNLYTPTMCCQPSIEDDRLWRVLSDLSLNQSSLQNISTLKAMLANYTPQDQRNSLRYLQSMKKINSLIDLKIRPKEILRSQGLLRGLCITLTVKSQDFGSHGEYFLFGCVLDRVFAANAAINTFTEIVFKDFNKGEMLSWAPRLGNRPIL